MKPVDVYVWVCVCVCICVRGNDVNRRGRRSWERARMKGRMGEIYLQGEEGWRWGSERKELETGGEGGRCRVVACVARAASVLIFPWLDRTAGVSFLFTTNPWRCGCSSRSVGEVDPVLERFD